MYLAVDVGGTKVTVARLRNVKESMDVQDACRYPSADFAGLEDILKQYIASHPGGVTAVGVGVAGPVVNGQAKVTNLPWVVDAEKLSKVTGAPCYLLNDLEAHGYGIGYLQDDGLTTIQPGVSQSGNRAIIAAGTGLGECILFWDGRRHVPRPSEGSHANFGPGDQRDCALLTYLWKKHGHVSWERVVSGLDGFRNLYDYLVEVEGKTPSAGLRQAAAADQDIGAAVVAADANGCAVAAEVLDWFVRLYGAEAGNLALKALAVGGLYLCGGIAQHILPRLRGGAFAHAFVDKGRFRQLLTDIPVHVVTDAELSLKGAARFARLKS